MVLVLVVLSAPHPVGGALSRYHRANALARRGHEVHVVHLLMSQPAERSVSAAVPWFDFEPGIRHHFDFDDFPPGFRSEVALGVSRHGLVPASMGRPLTLLQGLSWNGPHEDAWIAEAEGPIVCLSEWLVAECVAKGVEAHRVRRIPNGLDHRIFRVTVDPAQRPLRVAFLYHSFPPKGAAESIAALQTVKEAIPQLEATAFGTESRPDSLPAWIDYVERPGHRMLAEDVYNRCRAFVCTSWGEGFGNTSLEAMACGCALVTFDTKGSREYARDGETALVCDRRDVQGIATRLAAVVEDDELRQGLTARSIREAAKFTWERTAAELESLLEEYVAHPDLFVTTDSDGRTVGKDSA